MPSNSHGVTAGSEPWTIIKVIQWTTRFLGDKGVDTPRLDAEVLLADLLLLSRVDLYLNYDRPLSANELATYRERIRRRAAREPVAYITGHKEFFSLEFLVGPGVLIPRPETEHLVEKAVLLVQSRWPEPAEPNVIDVGTGSGAIVVTLAKELPHACLWAVDVMDAPLKTAADNARKHRVEQRIQFIKGDLLAPLTDSGRIFHIITANLPYIPQDAFGDMAPDVRDYEPITSLDGGRDGLDLIRRIIAPAFGLLAADGALLLEIWPDQGPAIERLAQEAGFQTCRIISDFEGRDRIVVLDKKEGNGDENPKREGGDG